VVRILRNNLRKTLFIKEMSKTLITILLVFIVIAGGYFAWQYWPKGQPVQPVVNNQVVNNRQNQNQIPTDETADWKTYTNERYGFEVRYPSNYEVLEISDNIAIKPATIGYSPEYSLIVEKRERKTNETWKEFLLAGAKLEEKQTEGVEFGINDQSTTTDISSGKEMYSFCRVDAPTVCHRFYAIEVGVDGFPTKGIDFYVWYRYQALGNPYVGVYEKILQTVKFLSQK